MTHLSRHALVLALGSAVSGCVVVSAAPPPVYPVDVYDPGFRAVGGAVLGAGAGAALGALAGGGRGAAIGAVAGGAIGALSGAARAPQAPPYPDPAYGPRPYDEEY